MYGPRLSRTFEYVAPSHDPEGRHEMHGSLHMILATEIDRSRRADAAARRARRVRAPLATLAGRLAAAHGIPPRAAPGRDSHAIGRHRAATLRGR
jgi:hypothetical protein